MDIQNTKHIRTVSTSSTNDFQKDVNALLKEGYVLLHVGFEIAHDQEGRLVTPTIAVLGSEKPAPPPVQVVVGGGGAVNIG